MRPEPPGDRTSPPPPAASPDVTVAGTESIVGVASLSGSHNTVHITIIHTPAKPAEADHGTSPRLSVDPLQREVLRTHIIQKLLDKLEHQRRLLVLSPRRGGARTLVRQMVARSEFPEDSITRLWPSPLAKSAADYFAALTGDSSVQSAMAYDAWQRRRLRPGIHRHLIVLSHDGGETALLQELGEVLRGYQHDERFCILVAGEARAAALKYGVADNSYFSGMPVEQVPPLSCEELAALLGCDAASAAAVHAATSGHPAFVRAVTRDGIPFETDKLSAQLARAPDVRDILGHRLKEDDLKQLKKRHAAHVLRALLDGKPVRPLDDLSNDLRFPEVRLYYDGMLHTNDHGETVFRCEAVRRAAAIALRHWEEVQE